MSTAQMVFGLVLVACSFGVLIVAASAVESAVCSMRGASWPERGVLLLRAVGVSALGLALAAAGGRVAGGL